MSSPSSSSSSWKWCSLVLMHRQPPPPSSPTQTLPQTFLLKGRHQPVPFLYDTNLSACKTSAFIIFTPFVTFLLPRPILSRDGATWDRVMNCLHLNWERARQGGQLQMLWAIDSTTSAECLFARCCHLLRVLERWLKAREQTPFVRQLDYSAFNLKPGIMQPREKAGIKKCASFLERKATSGCKKKDPSAFPQELRFIFL